jgi:subtilisin family serine protease
MGKMVRRLLRGGVAAVLAMVSATARAGPVPGWEKVAPALAHELDQGRRTDILLLLSAQADLTGAEGIVPKSERVRFVVTRLREAAARSQGPLVGELESRGIWHRPFWVVNALLVRGDAATARYLAGRPEVASLLPNPRVRFAPPAQDGEANLGRTLDTEWNVAKVRAPEAWVLGITGRGAVIGGQDTGYQWDHPALKRRYRGWDGASVSHSRNWHDAIHDVGGGICGSDSPSPCDDYGHGTHTMGTMVGDQGGIGVAPEAVWIGCRNMDRGVGTPATYAECFQWFLAPTDPEGNDPDPAWAPDVINNSWSCPPSEGCTDPSILETVVANVRAAGILVVSSAGNEGSACATVTDPPAIYDASLSVGATTADDRIAAFSSRGPVEVDGSFRLKPDVAAPGAVIRSAVPTNGYSSMSGTSMAAPHVAGLAALLISADPSLKGDPDRLEELILSGAFPLASSQECGGIPGSAIPNNTFGRGRIDAMASLAPVSCPGSPTAVATASPTPVRPREPLTLDGRSSLPACPERPLATFRWDLAYDGTSFTADADGALITAFFDQPGLHHVALEVGDGLDPPRTGRQVLSVEVSPLLENGSFEAGGRLPDGWGGRNLEAGDGRACGKAALGDCTVRLGGTGRSKGVESTLAFAGRAGDRLTLSGWVKSTTRTSTRGRHGIGVALRHPEGEWSRLEIPAGARIPSWSRLRRSFTAAEDYDLINVRVFTTRRSGVAHFDGVALAVR